MIHLKITPDSRLSNEGVEQFAQTLCMYRPPMDRWNGRGFNQKNFLSFETVLAKEGTCFVVTAPQSVSSIVKKALETSWPRVTIEEVVDSLQKEPSHASVLELKYHHMFAIRVDRRETGLLHSLLETINSLEKDEEIYIQTIAVPAEKDWFMGAAEAYDKFKKGEMPGKISFSKGEIGKQSLKLVTKGVLEVISIITELMIGDEPEKINLNEGERAIILRDGELRRETIQKVRGDAYDVSIRIVIISDSKERAVSLERMVTMAFRELDGDNHFISRKVDPRKLWRKMKERKMGLRLSKDYLSIPEVSRLFLLPTRTLQEKYHLSSIKLQEVDIPELLLQGGIRLGQYTNKGETVPVYMPTKNKDILCLPHVVIGPMGSGKTKGYAANWMVQAIMNGFGAMSIDAAKGEIGDVIEMVLPSDKIVRINLSKVVFGLDWCEAKYGVRSKGMMADSILAFFDDNTDTAGAQTQRFLAAAVHGMQTGKLKEIIKIFQDESYRQEVIRKMPATMHKTTLEEFSAYKPDRQRQIIAPIYNRLNIVLGDEWLMECMESDNSLDMVELMSRPQAVIFDVLKKDGLTNKQIDLIVNLLTTKINLAMQLRPEEKQIPFFVIYDEPHRFLRSSKLWEDLAVESRKWRIGFAWMFHSFEQIPRNLIQIIKDAGPHYHIYSGSSKETWRALSEEIFPYTLDDVMKLPQFHAMNVFRTKDGMVPFVAKMSGPPSQK